MNEQMNETMEERKKGWNVTVTHTKLKRNGTKNE